MTNYENGCHTYAQSKENTVDEDKSSHTSVAKSTGEMTANDKVLLRFDDLIVYRALGGKHNLSGHYATLKDLSTHL